MTRALLRPGLTAALGVGALAVTLATATPASAAFEYQNVTAQSWATGAYFCVANGSALNHSAVGCFAPNGDLIEPGDLKVDGKRVAIYWKTSNGRSGLCVNATGKDAVYNEEGGGGKSPGQGKHLCNKDLSEGATITFKVGTCDASAHSCASVSNYGEWSAPRTRKVNG